MASLQFQFQFGEQGEVTWDYVRWVWRVWNYYHVASVKKSVVLREVKRCKGVRCCDAKVNCICTSFGLFVIYLSCAQNVAVKVRIHPTTEGTNSRWMTPMTWRERRACLLLHSRPACLLLSWWLQGLSLQWLLFCLQFVSRPHFIIRYEPRDENWQTSHKTQGTHQDAATSDRVSKEWGQTSQNEMYVQVFHEDLLTD